MNLHVNSGKRYLEALKEIKEGKPAASALSSVGIADYGPSLSESVDAELVSRVLLGMAARSPPTRQDSQAELADLLKALGLGGK